VKHFHSCAEDIFHEPHSGAVLRWGQGAQAPPVAAQAPQFPLMLFPDGLRAAIGWGPDPSRIFGLEPRLTTLNFFTFPSSIMLLETCSQMN
jgi:hypothetical protein